LLWRQRDDGQPDPVVTRLRSLDRDLGDFGHRDRTASPGAVVVDRLAVGDRDQPAAQVAVVLELRVGTQRRQERLLEAVLGALAPDRPAQHGHHLGRVLVDQDLERGQCAHHMD
jgi:hypothetical protein